MWFFLALVTAFFTSLQDVCGIKIVHKADVYVIVWGWVFFCLPFLYAYLFVDGMSPIGPSFGKALAVSTVILIIASILYMKAIKYSDLSITMPMLAFTPLLLLITSPMILGEFPGMLGILGVIFIVGGSYVLHFQDRRLGLLEPFKRLYRERGPRYMLLVAILYSVGANIDKIGVVNSSPIMWAAILNSVLAIAFGIIMFRRSKHVLRQIKSVWIFLVLIGFFNAVSAIAQMTAIKMTLVPYLIAVKRVSVVMSSLFGFYLFKEKGVRERLIGVVLMVLGAILILIFQ